jgi:hypothetical protein
MKACLHGAGGSRGVAPLILNLGTRWNWVVNVTLRSLHAREKDPVPMECEAWWALLSVWTFWRRESSLPSPGIRNPVLPGRRLFTILTYKHELCPCFLTLRVLVMWQEREREEMRTGVLWESLKERDLPEDRGIDGRINIKTCTGVSGRSRFARWSLALSAQLLQCWIIRCQPPAFLSTTSIIHLPSPQPTDLHKLHQDTHLNQLLAVSNSTSLPYRIREYFQVHHPRRQKIRARFSR